MFSKLIGQKCRRLKIGEPISVHRRDGGLNLSPIHSHKSERVTVTNIRTPPKPCARLRVNRSNAFHKQFAKFLFVTKMIFFFSLLWSSFLEDTELVFIEMRLATAVQYSFEAFPEDLHKTFLNNHFYIVLSLAHE